ncbi:unnamed protein product [Periconia digitata]|uniref:Uncharacterized protein n=1 Tax=Periconia digitata TaxID=1303443 RepID=A0A9W4UGD8_9PLEO|nr:unnamed protein product [Periconia digitata]
MVKTLCINVQLAKCKNNQQNERTMDKDYPKKKKKTCAACTHSKSALPQGAVQPPLSRLSLLLLPVGRCDGTLGTARLNNDKRQIVTPLFLVGLAD